MFRLVTFVLTFELWHCRYLLVKTKNHDTFLAITRNNELPSIPKTSEKVDNAAAGDYLDFGNTSEVLLILNKYNTGTGNPLLRHLFCMAFHLLRNTGCSNQSYIMLIAYPFLATAFKIGGLQ